MSASLAFAAGALAALPLAGLWLLDRYPTLGFYLGLLAGVVQYPRRVAGKWLRGPTTAPVTEDRHALRRRHSDLSCRSGRIRGSNTVMIHRLGSVQNLFSERHGQFVGDRASRLN